MRQDEGEKVRTEQRMIVGDAKWQGSKEDKMKGGGGTGYVTFQQTAVSNQRKQKKF